MIEWLLNRSTSEQWLIGLPVLVFAAFASQWFGQRLSHSLATARDINNRSADAAATFRKAFGDIVLNIKENPDLPSAQIARLNYHGILAAANEFRPYVPWLRKYCFDRAVNKYKKAHNIATENGSILAQFASEQSDHAQAKRKKLSGAIRKLLSFAEQI